jgi:hypothetical protein
MAKRAPNSDGKVKSEDQTIIDEAKKRFKRCQEWESVWRKNFVLDVKFANADAYNLWQWPEGVRNGRELEERPMLTVNKTRQHCLNILNDARQNKSSVTLKPTGNEATYESAQIFEGVVRHIEYISNAQSPYQHALRMAVQGGLGYWRVVTDYVGDESFDQEIYIRRIKDPLSVYLDPDISETDGSDARFGIIFDDMATDAFKAAYPKHKEIVGQNTIDQGDDWLTEDHVRVAEYFRCVPHTEQLIAFMDPTTGVQTIKRGDQIDRDLFKSVIDLPATKVREIISTKVEWFVIAGDQIIERREWAGKYVPIVRVIGEETIIDGKLDRKGHVRALIDPQRMYNYNASAAVEFGALQSKTPYVGPAAAIEGNEELWFSANRINHAYLPFNHMDEAANPIPAPVRQQPPMGAPVYQQGMANAAEDMRLVSGQYQSDMGAPGNERSGVAIEQRQRQGDTATYHYVDNQSSAIRFTGKILIDLIPKVYDTERLIKIMGEDGSETEVKIDPEATQAMQKQKVQGQNDKYEVIFNPNVGSYDVEADIGPAFATRRQEAFNAISQILAQNKDLTLVIGDLLMKNADFPGADEMAQRLRRMVPPQALGDEAEGSAALQQLQMQNKALQELLGQLTQKLADKDAELGIKKDQKVIDAYDAETKRLAALKDALPLDPEGLTTLIKRLIDDALGMPPLPDPEDEGGAGGAPPMMEQVA